MHYQHWQEISFYLNEIHKEKLFFVSKPLTIESMEASRNNIASLLGRLKSYLEQRLDKHYASLAIFSIVAWVDEEMQSIDYNQLKARWNPLQKDFYSAYTAGEVFFETIDKILDDPTVPQIVYEVFYFILKKGFKGKYRDSKTQLSNYLELLKRKISVTHPKNQQSEPASTFLKQEKRKKWHYYASAFGLSIITYLALYVYSNFDK